MIIEDQSSRSAGQLKHPSEGVFRRTRALAMFESGFDQQHL